MRGCKCQLVRLYASLLYSIYLPCIIQDNNLSWPLMRRKGRMRRLLVGHRRHARRRPRPTAHLLDFVCGLCEVGKVGVRGVLGLLSRSRDFMPEGRRGPCVPRIWLTRS